MTFLTTIAPLGKNPFDQPWKNPLWAPPGNNLSNTHTDNRREGCI